MTRLCGYHWPGNVRQLEHVLLNAWVMVEGSSIEERDLSLEGGSTGKKTGASIATTSSGRRQSSAPRPASSTPPALGGNDTSAYENVEEKVRILQALEGSGWNKVKAAKVLGIPRRTFYRRLQQYGISYPVDEDDNRTTQ
jgi:serine/threonine-protein kinase PknK